MEIKIKIPTFFAKYRVVKIGNTFYSQKKSPIGWTWMGEDGCGWSGGYRDMAHKSKTLEEAIQLIESTRERVVWSGR